jgi:general secretion pathway protein D
MIGKSRVVALLLILSIAVPPASADKAKSLWDKGRDAEARQNYEAAYDLFRQAYELKPKDVRYRASYERTRFLAASSHVHRGQILRDGGKLNDALVEFRRALEIDPSSFIAQQELRRTQTMIRQAESGPKPQAEIERSYENVAGPVELAPINDQPITLQLTEDTKVIYETVGKLAGLNVLFDPDYTSRRVRIALNGVSLSEALEIVSLESKTFWRPVTPNTIYVAANTKAKRNEVEQQVLRTFYLSNLSQPTELQDVVNTLRQILEIQRVQALQTQGAVVVRGTPDQIALAEKLINDIDRAKPEVMVEVAVMQVSRDKLRQLGIQPPTSTTIAMTDRNSSTTTSGDTTSGSSSATGTINLNSLANLDARNFQLTVPSATANFLFSDSSTKIIQNPQIRALDGQKATLKIGDKVPVATGSFQPGIGGVGINPLVNTQFQYIDVGVNIDVTPRVHAGREVSLKIVLEVSAVTRNQNIGGIEQPVIGQRRVEHDIRLKDGEVNLLGGILEQRDVKALSGIPGLAQIPILRYLFSSENVEHAENEIVFALIPHIVRAPEVSEINTRAIDIGTATAIEVRRMKAAQPQAAPQVAPQPAQQPQVQPPAPPLGETPTPQANPPQAQQTTPEAVGGAIFSFDPPTVSQQAESTFAVNVVVNGARNVYSAPLQINFDPNTLQLVNISNGDFLGRDGQAVAVVHREDAATGSMMVTGTRPPGSGGISGEGTLFTLTFQAKQPGQSTLSIQRAMLRDPEMQSLPASGSQAAVTITPKQ